MRIWRPHMSDPSQKQYDIVIVGGGISGLSLLHFIRKRAPHLTTLLIEKEERVGGWVKSVRSPSGQLYELGPRTLLASPKMDALRTLLEGKQLLQAKCKERYMLLNGKLQKFPSSLSELVFSPLGRLLIYAKLHDLLIQQSAQIDESVSDFFKRRCGVKAGALLSRTIVTGIYAADPSQLSVKNAFKDCWEEEKRSGRNALGALYREKKGAQMLSFKGGLCELIDDLTPSDVLLQEEVVMLEEQGDYVDIKTTTSQSRARLVISTLPTFALKRVLPSADAYQEYLNVPYTSLTTVGLGYARAGVVSDGFGYLNAEENSPLLGVVYDSSIFPEISSSMQSRATIMLRDINTQADEDIVKAALAHTGYPTPDEWQVQRAVQAIPCWPVGYQLDPLLQLMKSRRLKLAGSWVSGVSVPSCIQHADQVSIEVNSFFG